MRAMPNRVLAIIPARGGSKGIPRKNLVELGGKPLLAHSIAHALACPRIDRVVVSTEDAEIAETALHYGAEVPFMRPAELAGDQVLDLPVFQHVVNELAARQGWKPDIVVQLRPTAPHRDPAWITAAIAALEANPAAHSVRSVSLVTQHPYRVFELGADGFLSPVMLHRHPQPYVLRRQDLPDMYYYNCVIDVTRPNTLFELDSMTGDRILPYIMDAADVIDIDAPRDLTIAKALFWSKP
jgi:CMP-N,N'-diacetyllegionaminic acid synthase